MNRPFGAVDVAANMKGAVPKAATQKILVALAEKGELTQKLYGMPDAMAFRAIYPIQKLISDNSQARQLSLLQANRRWRPSPPKNWPNLKVNIRLSMTLTSSALTMLKLLPLVRIPYTLPSAENNLNLELAKLKSTPTDNEVTVQLNEIAESVGTLTPSHNASLFACFPSMTLLSCRLKKQTFA